MIEHVEYRRNISVFSPIYCLVLYVMALPEFLLDLVHVLMAYHLLTLINFQQ